MPLSILHTNLLMAVIALTGVVGASTPIALANFQNPPLQNLPAECQAAYERHISGCEVQDFKGKSGCSAGCVQGLVDIQKAVLTGCAGVDVPETSIIGLFLLGQGIPVLCPGVAVTTVQRPPAASSSFLPPQTSTVVQVTTTIASSPPAQQTSTASRSASGAQPQPSSLITSASASTSTSTRSSSSSSSSGIEIDTTVPTDAITVFPTSPTGILLSSVSSAAQSSSTPNIQKSNPDSGGGSPFDIVASGSSAPVASFTSLALAVMLGAMFLLNTIAV